MPPPIDLSMLQGANLPELARSLGIDYRGFGGMPPASAGQTWTQPSKVLTSVPQAMRAPMAVQREAGINPAQLLAFLRMIPGVLGPAAATAVPAGSVDPGVQALKDRQYLQPALDYHRAASLPAAMEGRPYSMGVAGARP